MAEAKRSLWAWIAHKIGLDATITVNCWYCNENSSLPVGGKQSKYSWYCHQCENFNFCDENGEILDAPNNGYSSYNILKAGMSMTMPNERQLCEACQRKQLLIYQCMSDYLLEDSDDEMILSKAQRYQKNLQEKHPLCVDCCRLVQDVIGIETEFIRRYMVNIKRQMCKTTAICPKPSHFRFLLQGFIWAIVHLWVMCLYCLLPLTTKPFVDHSRCSLDLYQHFLIMLNGQHQRSSVLLSLIQKWDISCMIDITYNAFSSIFLWCVLLQGASTGALNWHWSVTKTYHLTSRFVGWGLYISLQRVMFCFRLAIFYVTWWQQESSLRLILTLLYGMVSVYLYYHICS
ncbi:hypothetical protein DM01DRAFT_1180484 [Hesseltinella vesiculosa]|uniref:Ima1 N-terminal domain-containing protein n=1 Tax=Hesseltinella vesiculosa TaxID=101127 RepID=A0A1X2G449_9FUNG|nr:hypothetical protein DM01DRAFT_1180484 [Hesseltinella vesiculosa]